jgi:cytochrome c-type biogenesis protein CcmF
LAAWAMAVVGSAATFALARGGPVLAPFAVGLALFVIAGAVSDLVERVQLFRVPLATAARRARGLPRSTWGSAIAHLALGVTLIGVVSETQWSAERVLTMRSNETVSIAGYDLTFEGTAVHQGPNYRELLAKFSVRRDGILLDTLGPSKRNFPVRGTTTTEAALMTRGFSQIYLSLGDPGSDGSVAIRIYYKPFVLLIWLGAVVMAIGGALSLSDRRLRVGAPRPARPRVALQPAE